jgi:starch-binding outer membrane protein, SusD/RagB family
MKKILLPVLAMAIISSCKKTIDLYPQSNLNTGTYYSTTDEVRAGLTGCYNGMQRSLFNEWQLTELRSDNSKQGVPASTASTNRDLSDLDMFIPATTHQGNYVYWQATYNNIRNCNIVLDRLGVNYEASTGTFKTEAIPVPITEADRRQMAAEAQFIRAYHYFNLVRLYGGVFLIHEPITPQEAKTINRAEVAEIYKLVIADLASAAANLSAARFSAIPAASVGRANSWAAKGMLAKVYLTLNRKSDAIPLLQDVMGNSGYALQAVYANVFSITNEMNSEILFAVRFKAGGFGLGSHFGNTFAPLGSGSAVINGDGDGLNYPSADLDTTMNADTRKATNIAVFGTGSSSRLYVRKYLFPVVLVDDGESDWPILRYADIILMLAEAQGFTTASVDLINQVRPRAGKPNLTSATVSNVAQFERALADERRLEFAFENQRYFDLMRFNSTLTTITAEQSIRAHYAREYQNHYRLYPPPTPTLAELQSFVTRDKLLLPIPQREIDTNTQLVIPQNPGY